MQVTQAFGRQRNSRRLAQRPPASAPGHALRQRPAPTGQVADVLVHHPVAQCPRGQPGLTGLRQQAQAGRAVQVVKHAAQRLANAGQQGRQQLVACGVLQARKSGRKRVQTLGQHRVSPQAGRPLGRERLGEQALVSGLQMLCFQRHGLQQEGQAQALCVNHHRPSRRCHRRAPRGGQALQPCPAPPTAHRPCVHPASAASGP